MRSVLFLTRNALLVGLVVMGAFFWTQSDAFLTVGNLRDVAVQVSILGLVAVASALLLLGGGIDLSVGSTMALGGIVTGRLLVDGQSVVVAIGAGILAGAVVGLLNGILSSMLGFSPIIVTLGTLTAVRGAAFYVSENPVYNFPDSFTFIGRNRVAGIPILVIVCVLAYLVATVWLNRTAGGRHLYAVGVNPEAAFLSGLPVRRIGVSLFVLTGAAAGFGGVLLVSRLNSASPSNLGVGFEIDVLTAALLGGIAFGGGRGKMSGVALGVVFLGILSNGLILMNVFTYTQLVVKGLALMAAAGLHVLADRLTERVERSGSQEPANRAQSGDGVGSPIHPTDTNSRPNSSEVEHAAP